MVMSDLAEFLLARIAEDEDRARDPKPPRLRHIVWSASHTAEDHVLADCEAKRRIVAVLNRETPVDLYVLRALADPYADHPDFREEWRA